MEGELQQRQRKRRAKRLKALPRKPATGCLELCASRAVLQAPLGIARLCCAA